MADTWVDIFYASKNLRRLRHWEEKKDNSKNLCIVRKGGTLRKEDIFIKTDKRGREGEGERERENEREGEGEREWVRERERKKEKKRERERERRKLK